MTVDNKVSGAPKPMKATEPKGSSSEMLKAVSAGCIVPVMACSMAPEKSATGSVLFSAAFKPMIPKPVSLEAKPP